jgi:deoxyribodipyrimidine photolyase-like uncharacterized protein
MQRAKLFGALFAYVNNIQITWKTIHLSIFCRTNSSIYSTDQSRAEGNNTDVLERKDSMAKCYQQAWERACVMFPLFGQGILHHIFFLMVICNSLLLLKSLPINIINCIKFYVNCSALTGAYDWQ